MKALIPALVMAAACSTAAHASEPSGDKPLELKPILIEGDEGATLGLEYALDGVLWEQDLSSDEPDCTSFCTDQVAVGDISIRYRGQGVITATADKNPRNFLDLSVDALATYSTPSWGAFRLGGFVKFETDQQFDDQQWAYGARAAYAKQDFIGRKGDSLALYLGYGRVEPNADEARKTALGAASLDAYDRVEFEALYMLRTGWSLVDVIEFNYRTFQEIDAPAPIRAAGLQRHELGSVRLNLPNDLFIAYSDGSLPFDRKSDQAVKIGWSYKLF